MRRADRAEYFDQRARRQLLALGRVQPERLAVVAGVERQRRKRIARECERPHALAAAGTGQLGHVRSSAVATADAAGPREQQPRRAAAAVTVKSLAALLAGSEPSALP